jgi:hypothetical protein
VSLGSHPDQFERRTNIVLVANPKADPTRAWKNMVWQSAPSANQRIAIRTTDEAVQQSVSMNVAGLFPVEPEINPTKPMNARLHAGPPTYFGFDVTDSANACWMKQTSHA